MQVNLVYFKPNGGRKDVSLSKDSTVIGRALDCDVQVPILGVSRRHCQLVAAGESLTVKDLGSSNGTYVNGYRVEQQPVSAGDRLTVGPVVLTVQVDGQPADIQPPQAEARTSSKPVSPAPIPSGSDADDEMFAQMMLDDEDDDSDPVAEAADPISALDLLQEDDDEDEKA